MDVHLGIERWIFLDSSYRKSNLEESVSSAQKISITTKSRPIWSFLCIFTPRDCSSSEIIFTVLTMVERKLYKTKLCVLYQRGHCPRQTCSFAHGDAELRRFSGSFNGRRDYRGSDLRDKLDRGRSPQRKYSPGRDAKSRNTYHGYSPSRSIEKKSDRKRRKKQLLDGQSDFSGGLKVSDGNEDRVKEVKIPPSDSKDVYEEQLKKVQSDINMVEQHKCQLEIDLQERVQEADSLTSRLQELEAQLCTETEECKRLTSKIKKFVKARNRHSRLQDELKRSEARLQKLGDQLGSDTTRPGATEEDSSINIVSDEENTANYVIIPRNELHSNASPSKKRPCIKLDVAEESKAANLTNGGCLVETVRSEKLSRWDVHHPQSNDDKEAEAVNYGNRGLWSLAN
ncbi:hypothetical protein L1049_024552 [Liquidambar formosana]|uniref:C3H1-type domain-containing protein n=1 Tax=Liquidambar formosana TaxID=63359 RepID=A0AAP0S0T0_LIQFO